MTEIDPRTIVYRAYEALARGDIDGALSFCAEDVVLTFALVRSEKELDASRAFDEIDASYEFIGRERLREPMMWMAKEFPGAKFIQRRIFTKGESVFHTLVIEVPLPDGKGLMPVHALYQVRNGMFRRIQVRFLYGILSLKPKE